MRNCTRGEILTKEELQEIRSNITLSHHALKRLQERNSDVEQFLNTILNPFIAYFNTDGSINIAKSNHECFVVERNKYCVGGYILITYKDATHASMLTKRKNAMLGIERI